MSITLYHCRHARSLRCLWALEELGIDHELVTLRFPPRVHHKEFKAVNPLGTVPCLVDGDLVMTESCGIAQYLAERYGPTPLAVGVHEPDYGAYLNWLHRADATLTFPQTLVFRYREVEPPERRSPQVVEDYRRWFLGRLRSLEAATEARDYLCSGRFTVADLCVAYALYFAERLGIEEAFTPNLRRWWERVSARPAFRKAVAA